MAIESCDCKDLLTAAKDFRDHRMNPIMRMQIQIVLLNYIIAALTRAESVYTLAELLDKGKCCDCIEGDLDHDAIFTYILWKYAESLSQSAPATSGELIDAACHLLCSGGDHKRILTPLYCEMFDALIDAQN